jgi:protocatechuate 3,4-dioxygenase alpha subunit
MDPTPHHTTGPFFPRQFLPDWQRDLTRVAGRDAPALGRRIELSGTVTDGRNKPAVNVILELSQADHAGRFGSDRGRDPGFAGWGRTATDREGRYRFVTVMPGPYPARGPSRSTGGWIRPPHLSLLVLGSGIMRPLATEIFFPDEPLNAADRQLARVPPRLRGRLVATALGPDRFGFDIRLSGAGETPFFRIPGL